MTPSPGVPVGPGQAGDSRPPTAHCTRFATTDLDEAERIVTDHYLPNWLELPSGSAPLRMELAGLRVGALTAGRLSYGRHVRQRTADAENFHVNLPLRGRALSANGTGEAVTTGPGESLVFSPGAPADLTWSPDTEQLCLMVPRASLEDELEHLTGRSVRGRLAFDFVADLRSPMARRWQTVLGLLVDELDHPTDLTRHSVLGRHVEGLVLDGLLLGQPHSHSEDLDHGGTAPIGAVVTRAVELIEERPSEPWTTVRLAAEVHLSVRALQDGFRRDLGTTPMAYLRQVRLRRARAALLSADPRTTTVAAVATSLGLLHLGRFAAAYRDAFGEVPSETLNRRT